MNFLAHIYLSGDNPRIQIGNFMADGIRGKDYIHYHTDIQIGVLLHRSIDSFTDAHPIFRQSKYRLVPKYNHFSGIIVDMFYDHFLALEWMKFHHEPLSIFVGRFYDNLKTYHSELNMKTRKMLPYLLKQNWLERYARLPDLQQILKQMDSRFPFPSKTHESVDELHQHYEAFQKEFRLFFKELIMHSAHELKRIIEEYQK